jgi:hypothetical protein
MHLKSALSTATKKYNVHFCGNARVREARHRRQKHGLFSSSQKTPFMVRGAKTCRGRNWRTTHKATNWSLRAPRRQEGTRGSVSTDLLVFILSTRLRWGVHIKSGPIFIPTQLFSLAVTAFQDHSCLELRGTWRNAFPTNVPWILNSQTVPSRV